MSDRPAGTQSTLIGGQYVVDLGRTLPDAGGGLPAYAASSRRSDALTLMALPVHRHAPARPRAMQALASGIDGLLTPLAQGAGPPIDGAACWYIISHAPTGPSLAASLRPWTEAMVIEQVMRPIALILDQLQTRGLTHRGIRANNVFNAAPHRPVLLGGAWSAPPAMHQPAVYETPYTAVCHPSARGDGQIADDVYALGVLLVTLLLGRQPMDGLDERTILLRKQELGDFAAIVGNERLPPVLNDIIRAMLAEDPDHRPPPSLLRDPAAARARRIAARPASHAQRSFKLGELTVWNTKSLGLAMILEHQDATAALLTGTLMYWLRRGLGDSMLAVKLEELVRQHALDVSSDKAIAQAVLLMRAVADVDELAPMCWRGLALLPDGLGPAIATSEETETDLHTKCREIVLTEAEGIWALMRDRRMDEAPRRMEARQRRAILQIRGPAGGMPRLCYTLNPQMPCVSPLLTGRWIAQVNELPAALDAIAIATPAVELIEPHIAAFIAARSERQLDQEVKGLILDGDPVIRSLATLRLLAEMQARYHPAPLTGLTGWVAARARPLIEHWQNRERRTEVEEKVKSLGLAGLLRPLLTLLEDPADHAADNEGLRSAMDDLARVDGELRRIAAGGSGRATLAARLGGEISAWVGLAVVALTLLMTAMG